VKAELLESGDIQLTEVPNHEPSTAFRMSINTICFDNIAITGGWSDLIKREIVSAINLARENAIAEFFEGEHGGEG